MLDISGLMTYAAVMSITPGPNNVMVTASGASFGYRATLPHILGIGFGVAAQIALVCAGLGALFQRLPWLHGVLAWTGAAYLLYLAWQLAGAQALSSRAAPRPLSWLQAAAFQAVNPKAWVMAITTGAVFLPREGPAMLSAALMALLFLIVNVPCVSAWALFGSALRGLLARPRYRLSFNVTMSALLLMTALLGLES